ncbi:lytic transglycosylase domain-containing protein [Ensifer sp. SL37]|uniref:lytic transglycosylase domain-containing protein n=1 Tax=Ensifer sp. SL37 TaxID=2995137 RepID=UPI0022735CCD|nr:lytic transglycosylase domain-containing protein [Ensifer sp. SL37]MCY1741004.1 lytic transglycosylase domain-containing protein [Ensifer sp. SL37]
MRITFAIALAASTHLAWAQGVPIIDGNGLAKSLAITSTLEQDVAVQGQKRSRQLELLSLDADIIAELDKLIAAGELPAADTAQMVETLEEGAGDPKASADNLYSPDEKNPAADKTFGDAALTVEQVIIAGAKATYGHAGVSAAGLSQAQWRALLQALIWQESRFNPFVGSPVGAWGLTQLMPGTAAEMGVAGDYRTNPYSQVVGGATYLAKMLNMFNGDVVLALAAYNAGPGNVRKHGGVPPFKETQNYVRVIPAKYNEYLAKIGGVDAEGTIEPVLAAGANLAMTGDATSGYGSNTASEIAAIAHRLKAIIGKMEQNENPTQAWALNTYARAEMARIMTLRVRVLAAQTKQFSAEALNEATAQAVERQYMQFSND